LPAYSNHFRVNSFLIVGKSAGLSAHRSFLPVHSSMNLSMKKPQSSLEQKKMARTMGNKYMFFKKYIVKRKECFH
jgi:hypothetical protein